MTYSEKLLDPRWQKKRLEVMSYSDFSCYNCGDSNKTLHVHHKFYLKDKEPWDYDLDQMECLCVDCHKEVGSRQQLLINLLSYLEQGQIDEVIGYVAALMGPISSTLRFRDWMPGFEYFLGIFKGSRPRASDDEIINFVKNREAHENAKD